MNPTEPENGRQRMACPCFLSKHFEKEKQRRFFKPWGMVAPSTPGQQPCQGAAQLLAHPTGARALARPWSSVRGRGAAAPLPQPGSSPGSRPPAAAALALATSSMPGELGEPRARPTLPPQFWGTHPIQLLPLAQASVAVGPISALPAPLPLLSFTTPAPFQYLEVEGNTSHDPQGPAEGLGR